MNLIHNLFKTDARVFVPNGKILAIAFETFEGKPFMKIELQIKLLRTDKEFICYQIIKGNSEIYFWLLNNLPFFIRNNPEYKNDVRYDIRPIKPSHDFIGIVSKHCSRLKELIFDRSEFLQDYEDAFEHRDWLRQNIATDKRVKNPEDILEFLSTVLQTEINDQKLQIFEALKGMAGKGKTIMTMDSNEETPKIWNGEELEAVIKNIKKEQKKVKEMKR